MGGVGSGPKPGQSKGGRPKGSGGLTKLELDRERYLEEKEALWQECNHARLIRGEITWDSLTDEEINHGYGYGIFGDFAGVKQKYGPTPFRVLKKRERVLMERARAKIAGLAARGINVQEEIMLDEEQPAAARLRAVEKLQERAWGSVPQVVATVEGLKFDDTFDRMLGMSEDDPDFDPDMQKIAKGLKPHLDYIEGEVVE